MPARVRPLPIPIPFVFAALLALLPAPCAALRASEREVWFEDISGRLAMDAADADRIAAMVYEAVRRGGRVDGDLPEAWRDDTSPRIVFVSASDAKRRAFIGTGVGRGLRAALESAVADVHDRGALGEECRWLLLDIVTEANPRIASTAEERLDIDRSLEGISFPREVGDALLPAELLAYTAVDSDGDVVPRNVFKAILGRGGVPSRAWAGVRVDDLPVGSFRTLGRFVDESGPVEVFRQHRVVRSPGADELLEAAIDAAAYLTRATGPDGRFDYSYLPKTNTSASSYNLVRHAGTIYAMVETWEVTRDPELGQAIERATEHLFRYLRPFGDGMEVLLSEDKVKLGGVGLTIVALAKRAAVTGDREHLPRMRRLALWLEDSQGADGRFVSQRYFPSGRPREDFDSQYYPGEAILALTRLHRIDGDSRWLDVAEKAARWLIEVRDRGVAPRELIHDHWLLYGLDELHRLRPRALYLDHAMNISLAITSGQNREPKEPDWLGSYYRPPRSTPTATRSEGLVAAWRLARDHGRLDDAARILPALELGISFELATRMGPEKVMYLTDPVRAHGGFHESLTNYEIRIDYVQHNISALLGYRQILLRTSGEEE